MENKQFEEWLKPVIQDNIALPCETVTFEDIQAFYKYPFSMQWGVYLEFFDSVGIDIEIRYMSRFKSKNKWHTHWGVTICGEFHGMDFPTRPEAQQEAIKKAFEILTVNNKESK